MSGLDKEHYIVSVDAAASSLFFGVFFVDFFFDFFFEKLPTYLTYSNSPQWKAL
jgi:hypothetical protein